MVEFWVDSILEGYITEIVVDRKKSYNEVERKFFQGHRGHYLKSLKFWIKMLVCKKVILRMDSKE